MIAIGAASSKMQIIRGFCGMFKLTTRGIGGSVSREAPGVARTLT
jgi:hypothetical protein